jgi:hypothetical protein
MNRLDPGVVLGFALMFGVSAAMFQALFQGWKAKKEEDEASRRRVVVQRFFSGRGEDEV